MNQQIALRHRSRAVWSFDRLGRALRLPGLVLLTVLSLALAWSWLPAGESAAGAFPAHQFAHWQDASHDWLLVIDPSTHELVVYDGRDGRPLERFGADDGLPKVQAITLQGPWLFVTGQPHSKVRLLKLPALQAVAANTR